MSQATAMRKLAKAARLSAEAARLMAEASEELETGIAVNDGKPEITDMDKARARKALTRVGYRT